MGPRRRELLDGGANRSDRLGPLGGLHDELHAGAAAQREQRRRSEHGRVGRVDGRAQRRGAGIGELPLRRRADDPDERRERRIGERRAALQLAREERVGVMARRQRDRARAGRVRLHEHAPGPVRAAPPGTAGELRDERERALLGAKVREAQRLVGVDHDAERDVREVMPLGDHLRADQHARRRRVKACEHRRARVAAGGVGVEAQHRKANPAQRAGELVLEPLGAGAVA